MASGYNSYLEYLQGLSRSARRQPEGTPFSVFWAKICQEAGIDPFLHDDQEDLTWDELYQIHVWLLDELAGRMFQAQEQIKKIKEKHEETLSRPD